MERSHIIIIILGCAVFLLKKCNGSIYERTKVSDALIGDCQSYPCKNGGTCTDKFKGFECKCKPGWEGAICQDSMFKRFAADDMEVYLETNLGVDVVKSVFGEAAADIAKNKGGFLEISNAIATSKTDIDFAKNIGMSQEDLLNLRETEELLRNAGGSMVARTKLTIRGVPENIITDLSFFFRILRDTGFFD